MVHRCLTVTIALRRHSEIIPHTVNTPHLRLHPTQGMDLNSHLTRLHDSYMDLVLDTIRFATRSSCPILTLMS
jgi:hypothetical protein